MKGIPPAAAIERLRRGVVLEDGTHTASSEINRVRETDSNAWFEVMLHEGRNQQIRRMFDLIGFSVVKLRRVRIGFLCDEKLRPGQWRLLAKPEVERLLKSRAKSMPHKRPRARLASHGSGRR